MYRHRAPVQGAQQVQEVTASVAPISSSITKMRSNQQYSVLSLLIQSLLAYHVTNFTNVGGGSMIGVDAAVYTATDDASWAVTDNELSNDILGYDRQHVYDEFMAGCRQFAGESASTVCDRDENFRMQMNTFQPRSMINFTEHGFLKVRAPAAVMELLEEFWRNNQGKDTIEWGSATPYHNTWETEPTITGIEDENLVGGGYALRAKVGNAIRDEMEKWTGMKQAISSVYGIRSYHNGSILTPHVDRLPLVSSAILNVAQDVDEDWPLEVYDHNGVAHNVTMKPGDLVLYESHSTIHGRPFAMKGNFYANIFVHFEPIGPLDASENIEIIHNNIKYPPYIIPNSSWEVEWLDSYPNGWNLLEDAPRLVRDGDLYTIKYAAKINPELWHGNEDWRPIHEAVRHGHLDVVRYLVLEHGVDINATCREYARTPYSLARGHLGDDHPVTQFLRTLQSEEVLQNEAEAEPYIQEEYDEGEEEEEYDEEGDEDEQEGEEL